MAQTAWQAFVYAKGLSNLAPVTYLLSPSMPSHRYTLCRVHTCVLSSYTAPEISSLSLPIPSLSRPFLHKLTETKFVAYLEQDLTLRRVRVTIVAMGKQ